VRGRKRTGFDCKGGFIHLDVYLDNAATTRTDPDIAACALEMMTACYGNPSSLHSKGLEASRRVAKARAQVAALMESDPGEIIFTSGGTEANNLALLGGAAALRRRGDHIVAAAFEHSSVRAAVKQLESEGLSVSWVNPLPDGSANIPAMIEAVTESTILVSCMLVNSETGAISAIEKLAAGVRRKNKMCLLHCDAVQGFGKIPLSVGKLGVDLLSVSAHKIYAPKGCGALYVRKGVRILPLLHGGGQERSLRPGTESTALIAAFGLAAEKAGANLAENLRHITAICEYFMNKSENFGGLRKNLPENATPYIRNISLPGYLSGHLVEFLSSRGVYVSGGSACSGGAKSHVLEAMGLPDELVASALRVSFSRYTTREEIDRFFAVLEEAKSQLIHK
jgi:cysteine desulfurase